MSNAERLRDWLAEQIPSVTTFVLRRLKDPTGVSGTGVVADGAVFPDFRAVTRWRNRSGVGVAQTCVWDNIQHVRMIHGHGGDTRIELVPYGVLVKMIHAALDVAADLEAVGDPVVNEMARVLDEHLAYEAELDAAAKG